MESRYGCNATTHYIISGGRNVNVQNVMTHELMPVPISIAEADGSLRTGTKSTLATLLTNPFVCPQTIVVPLVSSSLLIDGVALVCSIGKPPKAQTSHMYLQPS